MQESSRRGSDTASLHNLHIPETISEIPTACVGWDLLTAPYYLGPYFQCCSVKSLWLDSNTSLYQIPKEQKLSALLSCFAWLKSEMQSSGKQSREKKTKQNTNNPEDSQCFKTTKPGKREKAAWNSRLKLRPVRNYQSKKGGKLY